MLAETLAGVAIVAATVFAVCLAKAALAAPRVYPGVERATVLRCSNDAVGLEAAAREVRPGEELYILDAGMTPEALHRARILAKNRGARIVTENTEGSKDADGR